MTNDEIIRFFQDAPDDGSDESALRIGRAVRNAVLEEVVATLINERSLYLSKWKREAITACVERVRALKTKEGGEQS